MGFNMVDGVQNMTKYIKICQNMTKYVKILQNGVQQIRKYICFSEKKSTLSGLVHTSIMCRKQISCFTGKGFS